MSFFRSAGPYLLGAVATIAVMVGAMVASTYSFFGLSSFDSWLEFLLYTVILFGCLAYGYRTLLAHRMFWVLYVTIFLAHCVGWILQLEETGPWRTRAAGAVAFAELAIAVLVFTSIFRVAPTMRSNRSK
ncbi:MAG: hypothetical protein WBE86_04500 [Candidatus Acidiferrales bacterium]